jgi:hypothetical protein
MQRAATAVDPRLSEQAEGRAAGTGSLTGISGKMAITIAEGAAFFQFEYTLDEATAQSAISRGDEDFPVFGYKTID